MTFWFAVHLTLDCMLTVLFVMYLATPSSPKWFTLGVPFLLILPGIAVLAPIWTITALLMGSSEMLKVSTIMNSCLVALNYPLTLILLAYMDHDWLQISVIALLILNKAPLSGLNARVRAFWDYPNLS